MSLAEWSIRNRVAVNLLCVVILVAGWLAGATRLNLDLFPDVTTNFIQITTIDPATSSAEDIERTITVPLEEELATVRDARRLRSFSEDSISIIFLELAAEARDPRAALEEARAAVDKARNKLPASAEPPVVEEFDIPLPLAVFAVYYPEDADRMAVRPLFERLERRLRVQPGVSAVLTDGLDRREIHIEADPHALRLAGLSFAEIAAAVRAKNVNVAAGRQEAEGGRRAVRILEEVREPGELGTLRVRGAQGRDLLLREAAVFRAATEEARTAGRADLRPAVTFTVVKKKGADALETVAACRRIFAEEAARLPAGFSGRVLNDSTKFIRVRVQTVAQNGLQALLLVSVLLLLTLNWRLALLVAVGIPISFAGALLVLYAAGASLNLLSMFGMIMALGMVVDDAIVIAENAYRHIQAGASPAEAAVRGAREVFWPVVGSVSTTVAAFLPLIWAEGIIGKFLRVVPLVVIAALVFSLLQAFVVLPSHIADFVRRGRRAEDWEKLPPARGVAKVARAAGAAYRDLRDAVDAALFRAISLYRHALILALRWRYLALGAFAGLLGLSGALLATGLVPFKLFATDFADLIFLKAEMPPDTSLTRTLDALARVERRIAEELPADDLAALITRAGARFDPTNQFLEYGANLGLITVDIDEENPKCRKPSQIAKDLRRIAAEFPEFRSLTVEVKEGGPPVGRAVNVELSGEEFSALLEVAADVERRLAAIPGVFNVANDFPLARTEWRVEVDEERAARAGLDVAAVARELQAVFLGVEAARMRLGNEEVILRVKAEERLASDPAFLQSLQILNREGRPVALSRVATLRREAGLPRIKRTNQERTVTVSADVDGRAATSAGVNAQIAQWLPAILAAHPGVTVRLTGENEDTERSLASMRYAAIVALLLIYSLLAVITNSFLQPLVIMAVIPFGIVGVVLGLLLMGQPIGLMAIMGTIALAGIVVNNAVVFVDFINRYRRESLSRRAPGEPMRACERWRSIVASAGTRFRPVFLTTATTTAGLANLAFVSRGQEQFLAPMAQAIIFGLAFATFITLLLIPCLYSMLDDLAYAVKRFLGAKGEARLAAPASPRAL